MDTSQNKPIEVDIKQEPDENIDTELTLIKLEAECEDGDESEISSASIKQTEPVEFMKTELPVDDFLCDVCEETFELEEDLSNHKLKSTKCQDEDFNIKDEPKDEIENIYICSVCNGIHETKEELIDHKKENDECHEHKKCDKCGGSEEDFSSTWELKDHLKATHGMTDQDLIGNVFSSRRNMGTHKTTDAPYECKICSRGFIRWKNCLNHEKSHIFEFKCQFCPGSISKIFRGYSLMIEHLNTHLKPFQCNFCLKCFSQNKYLIAHTKSHTVTKESFQCQYCCSKYNSQESLVIHTKIHTGSFQCRMCLRSFHSKTLRSFHEKIHSFSDSLDIQRKNVIKLNKDHEENN